MYLCRTIGIVPHGRLASGSVTRRALSVAGDGSTAVGTWPVHCDERPLVTARVQRQAKNVVLALCLHQTERIRAGPADAHDDSRYASRVTDTATGVSVPNRS